MSTALTGRTPANTYKDILQVSNSNSGVDSSTRKVSDGEGTDSALQLSTNQVRVQPNGSDGSVYEVLDLAGNIIFSINTSTMQVTAGSGVKFVGDGSSLSGITNATGGISNTGSTNIVADSDANGSGDITLSIGSTEIIRITNNGSGDGGSWKLLSLNEDKLATLTGDEVAVVNVDGELGVQYPDATVYLKRKHLEWLKSNGFGNNDDLLVPHQTLSNNYAIIDKNGNYHWMVEIPRKNWDSSNLFASATIHPAFTVQGSQKRIFIGKYQTSQNADGQYVTQFGQNAKTDIDFDAADAAVQALNNGGDINGFHLMTNAEWALASLISKYLNTMPKGNNDYGRDINDKFVTGVLENGSESNFGSTSPARWLTGSGGVQTSHDGTLAGIFDLNGNIWEWVRGMRLNDGEIQILQDNDAAANLDVSSSSTQWKAIMPDGSLVAPGTTGTLKYDSVNAGTSGGVGAAQLDDVIDNSNDPDGFTYNSFDSLTADSGIIVPDILKSLALFPYTTDLGSDKMWMRNYGEHVPTRGGSWGGEDGAGMFAIYLAYVRSYSGWNIGFRTAFAL